MIANIQRSYRFTSDTDSFKVNITTIGASESFTFPFKDGGIYTNCTIDFGDGGGAKTITGGTDANRINVYATADTYTITISADACGGISVSSVTPYDKRFSDIIQWGTIAWDSELQFNDASNMVITATDVPDLSNLSSLTELFRFCSSIITIPNLDLWDVSGITQMQEIFNNCDSLDVSGVEGWDVSSCANLFGMFTLSSNTSLATLDLTAWDVSSCTNFGNMFRFSAFAGDCSGWTLKPASSINCSKMFDNSSGFNTNINDWVNTSSITNHSDMFKGLSTYNQPLNLWDTSNSINMSSMFEDCALLSTPNITGWDVSSVTNMDNMFNDCTIFNENISVWTMTSITTGGLAGMFNDARAFNQPIGSWSISGITSLRLTFSSAQAFNQDISSWNTSVCTNFEFIFNAALVYNQDLSSLDITAMTLGDGFGNSWAMSTANYDLLLNAWSLLTVQSGVTFTNTSNYTIATSQAARDILTNSPNNWTITGDTGI